jgi:flagellar motor switch protein FliN/FliY
MTSNKDYLSQEEIDALLRQTADDSSFGGGTGAVPLVEDYLSSLEQDAIGEIGNITFGSAATALSTLLGKKVDITTPKVSVIARADLQNEFPQPHVAVHVNYVDGFHGVNLLVIQTRDAQVIADLMMGGDGTGQQGQELSEIHISAVQEAMNQMMGSSATSMSTIFNRFVNISPPGIDILHFSEQEGKLPDEDVFIKISFRLTIGDLIDSTIMQLLPVSFAKEMVATLMGGGSMEAEEPIREESKNVAQTHSPAPAARPQDSYSPPPQAPGSYPMMEQPMPPYQQPMYQQPMYQQPMYQQPPMMPQQPAAYGGMPNRTVNVQPAQFGNFQSASLGPSEETNLNLLLDIPLKVTVELGRTHKVIKDILELSQGSIIELDKLAGEPVDILVNNKLIAKGEVVVIDENFGVRVTDIVNQWERIQKLQ